MRSVWLPPVAATATLLLLSLIWLAVGLVHARHVVVDEVHAALAADATVDIVVEVGCEPERFHALFFSRLAPVGGRTSGRQFFLSDIDAAKLQRIAMMTWVDSIVLWQRD